MTQTDSEHSSNLLHFARAVYAEAGIQPICLHLQDEYDMDVVLLLTCCWHGCFYGELSESQLARAMAFSEPWRMHLVTPLRHSRRWLKAHPAEATGIPASEQEALRQRVKALELDAEFMQLRALAALFAEPAAAPDTREAEAAASIRNNLERYRDYGSPPGTHRAAGLNEAVVATLVRASLRYR